MASRPRSFMTRSTTTQAPWYQGRTQQFNQALQNLLPLISNIALMRERMKGYRELEDVRGQRYTELENLRSSNAMKQLERAFINQIAQDPTIDSLASRANQLYLLGDTGDEYQRVKSELAERAYQVGKDAVAAYSPDQKLLPANFDSMLRNLGVDAAERIATKGQTSKMAEEQMTRIGEPALDIRRGELAVSMGQLGQRYLELQKDRDKMTREDLDDWRRQVEQTMSYLEGQGVKRGAATGEVLFNLFRSGKELNPLSPEHQGDSMAWLNQILTKINQGQPPDAIDLRFLSNVYKATEIAEKGLPTRETEGMMPGEYDQMMIKQIAERTKYIAQQNGIAMTDEQALEEAKAIYSELK